MDASWAAIGVTVGIAAIGAYTRVVQLLTRLEDGQREIKESHKEFIKHFDDHVLKDETHFEKVHQEIDGIDNKVSGLHARILAIQEKMGIVHHPPPVMIGETE